MDSYGVFADFYAKDWVCFHEYPFRIGHRFPLSPLVADFLTKLDVLPGQLLPQVWGLLLSVERLCSSQDIAFRSEDFFLNYRLLCLFAI